MTRPVSMIDRTRAVLVLAATLGMVAFNWMAAAGYVNGTTPAEISARFPTVLTPASYAFSIWTLIYAGLIGFSIYQLVPKHIERFRPVRSIYIFSCALNCAWLFFWQSSQIAICLAIIVALALVLLLINARVQNAETVAESFVVKGTFGLYLGWVIAAALLNLGVFLRYANIGLGESATAAGAGSILLAAALGVFIRVKFTNYFAPIAIAWALTAIAIKQSGTTLIVAAAAVGVIACLIAALSFVVNLPSSSNRLGRD